MLSAAATPIVAGEAFVLARLSSGSYSTFWALAETSGDAVSGSIAFHSLPTAFGDLATSGSSLAGPSLSPKPGMTVEFVALSEGRSPAFASAVLLDPALGETSPQVSELRFGLEPPALSASPASTDGNVHISWRAVSEATGYLLEHRTSGSDWLSLANLNAVPDPSIDISDLAFGEHFFRMRAAIVNMGILSEWSREISVTVLPQPQSAPVVTPGQSFSSTEFEISWSVVNSGHPAAYSYEVQWSSGEDFGSYDSAITDSPSAVLTVSEIGNYFVRVRAVLPGGEIAGPWSPAVSFTVGVGIPSLTVPSITTTPRITAYWSPVPPITPSPEVLYEFEVSPENDFGTLLEQRTTAFTGAEVWLPQQGSWFLRVRAIAGGTSGLWSNVRRVDLSYAATPFAPEFVRVWPSVDVVSLRWTHNYPAGTPQRLLRASEDGDFAVLADFLPTDSYVDFDVLPARTYRYIVEVLSAGGTLSSKEVSVTTAVRVGRQGVTSVASASSLLQPWVISDVPGVGVELSEGVSTSEGYIFNPRFGALPTEAQGPVALAAVPSGILTAFYTIPDDLSMARLHLTVYDPATSRSSTPILVSGFFSDVTDVSAAAGPAGTMVTWYDSLDLGYHAALLSDSGSTLFSVRLADSRRSAAQGFHRTFVRFDGDGNCHVIGLALDETGISCWYALLVATSESTQPFADPEFLPTPQLSADTISLAGFSLSGRDPSLSWIEKAGSTTGLLLLSVGETTPQGLAWGVSELVATGVAGAVTSETTDYLSWLVTTQEGPEEDRVAMVLSRSSIGPLQTAVDHPVSPNPIASLVVGGKLLMFMIDPSGELHYSAQQIASESPTPQPSGGGGGGCFVATSVFGGISSNNVVELTAIRDGWLSASGSGCSAIGMYYATSPAVSVRLRSTEALRVLIRSAID
ncbi:MAG: hypothetical protein Kow00107_06480 [Planctomycetota bacterium]